MDEDAGQALHKWVSFPSTEQRISFWFQGVAGGGLCKAGTHYQISTSSPYSSMERFLKPAFSRPPASQGMAATNLGESALRQSFRHYKARSDSMIYRQESKNNGIICIE